MSTNVKKSNRTSAKKIVLVGVFGAISTVLMLLSFNVPFIPTFVKLDFSDLPVLLGVEKFIWMLRFRDLVIQ